MRNLQIIEENIHNLDNINIIVSNLIIPNKRIRSNSEITIEQSDIEKIKYIEYKKNKNILYNLKLKELKELLGYYIKNYKYLKYYEKKHKIKLNKMVNKKQLIENIKKWYEINLMIEKIQKIFRGHLIRKLNQLRGPGLKNCNICLNETDFCTLEPLIEIEDKCFFKYLYSRVARTLIPFRPE